MAGGGDLSVWSEAGKESALTSFSIGVLFALGHRATRPQPGHFYMPTLCRALGRGLLSSEPRFPAAPLCGGQPLPYPTGEENDIPEVS